MGYKKGVGKFRDTLERAVSTQGVEGEGWALNKNYDLLGGFLFVFLGVFISLFPPFPLSP